MAHVTFIHGIANKPSKEKLLEEWTHSLARNGGLDLEIEGVTRSMVYWADVMYAAPMGAGSEESFEDFSVNAEDEDLAWIDELSGSEKEFVEKFRETLGFDEPPPEGEGDEYAPGQEPESGSFQAIPLPWFIKRRVMKAKLRDVHHYLFNEEYSADPGNKPAVRVQDHIRNLFVSQLQKDLEEHEGPHVVVSHSMGTVISYDCLKRVPECPSIDGYMTLGSPLGITEVTDNLEPEYTRSDGFPSERVKGKWVNVYDRFDPVCGADPVFKNDYRRNGDEVVTDVEVRNPGKWKHSSWKYFEQPALREHLAKLLGLS